MNKNKLKINIYLDGASIDAIKKYKSSKYIEGFTTNPSLMRKEGIKDYKKFANTILKIEKKKPISFEVFADDLAEMKLQAQEIASWGKNVYVKIPITNTNGVSTVNLIKELNQKKIKCNVTAIFTMEQFNNIIKNNNTRTENILSVFAGRIADTGVDPEKLLKKMLLKLKNKKNFKLLWASTREIFNIVQANRIGCDIITVPYELFSKINLFNKDLKRYSLETVKTFYFDALKSKYKIKYK